MVISMKECYGNHSANRDKNEPDMKFSLFDKEWGTWNDADPGHNPGFLYQQNSLRDALVAGITLNLFHARCDRIMMANIAQMVNVLQAMILTDKEKMVLTPTYHLFEMYKMHQGATLLPTELTAPPYTVGEKSVPSLSASASR